MAIKERINPKGEVVYQVVISRPRMKPLYQSFDTRIEAEHFEKTGKEEVKQCYKPKPSTSEEFRVAQFKGEKLVDTTARFVLSDAVAVRHMNVMPTLLKHIGKVTLGDLRKAWVRDFVRRMRKIKSRYGRPFTDQTIAVLVTTISVIVKWRMEDLEITPTMAPITIEGIKGKWKVKRIRRLEPWEERALMARIRRIETKNKYHWRLLVQLALETGARLQEMIYAEWNELEIDRRLWTIPAEHEKCGKVRCIPLTAKATRIFRLLKLLENPADPRMFHLIAKYATPKSPGSFPSPGNPGKPATPGKAGSTSTCFARYVKQAGITGFRFHDLRHEAISRMALYWRNFSIFQLMLITGHTRMDMFQTYANLRGDELVALMDS